MTIAVYRPLVRVAWRVKQSITTLLRKVSRFNSSTKRLLRFCIKEYYRLAFYFRNFHCTLQTHDDITAFNFLGGKHQTLLRYFHVLLYKRYGTAACLIKLIESELRRLVENTRAIENY